MSKQDHMSTMFISSSSPKQISYATQFCMSLIIMMVTTHRGHSLKPDDLKYLIGVSPDKLEHYSILGTRDSFSCLDGSSHISKESVNDDYCDCPDGSDEPGTSACINGQFYCKNEGYLPRYIPSSWVNDAHCDCCDATDEYLNPQAINCSNNCDSLGANYRRELEHQRELYEQGSTLRIQYKDQARVKREQNNELLQQYRRELTEKDNAIKAIEEEMNADFGPSSVFLPLKGRCFSFKDREYTYKLCPFDRAVQESSGMQIELGRWSGWAGTNESPYSRQKYEGGTQCWNGPARSATINIACGVEDKVISVTEPSKCEYVYDYITPAACPDNDPPVEEAHEVETATESASQAEDSLSTNNENVDELDQGDDYEAPLLHSDPPAEEKHDEL